VACGRAEDYEQFATLTREIGWATGRPLAPFNASQEVALVTAAITTLLRTRRIRDTLLHAGRSSDDARLVADECADGAFWLLMEGIDARRLVPMPETPSELGYIVERRGVDSWRRVLGHVAANPWGRAAAHLTGLARSAGLDPAVVRLIARCGRVYRELSAESERVAVANEIRRLVAISGCTQREFAMRAGTSAPRLSTYASGRVTPSAAMMLRISRLSSIVSNGTRTS
jgi:hypothetical protein